MHYALVFSTSKLKYAKVGSLVKLTSPDTREFLNGKLVTAGTDNAEDRAWVKISAVVGDGSNNGEGNLESGLGPITLNDIIMKIDNLAKGYDTIGNYYLIKNESKMLENFLSND